jgi:ketosteroid isomerase-like protein
MLETAPAMIARFMKAAAERDYAGLGECFTEDAIVSDERQTHRGRDEIRRWQEAGRAKWNYTATATDGEATSANQYRVAVHLEGNFPGGEADVDYRFTILDGLISELQIG